MLTIAKGCLILYVTFVLCEFVHSACYIVDGCNMPEGSAPSEAWSPPDEKCVSCNCEVHRVDIGTCSEFFYTVKKSTAGYFVEEEEEKEVLENEADLVDCSNTLSWQYDDQTGELIMPTGLRHVTYFYFKTKAQCCSTEMTYTYVPPGCKVINEDDCTSKIVLAEDTSQSCNGPYYMVG